MVQSIAMYHKQYNLIHRYIPIRCYHSRSEWTLGQWQWKGTLHFSKLQHYWSFTIRLFSVMSRTLVVGVVTPLQRSSRCILQPQPTGQPYISVINYDWSWLDVCIIIKFWQMNAGDIAGYVNTNGKTSYRSWMSVILSYLSKLGMFQSEKKKYIYRWSKFRQRLYLYGSTDPKRYSLQCDGWSRVLMLGRSRWVVMRITPWKHASTSNQNLTKLSGKRFSYTQLSI